MNSLQIQLQHAQKYHAVVLKFLNFGGRVTREPLNGKTSFQAHIVELHKSYRMIAESWESVQGNQSFPLFAQGTFVSACGEHAQKRSLRSSWMSPGYGT